MNGFALSLIAGLLPMILYAWLLYYLDRYEKEPLKLLAGVFIWGAVIAAGAAFVINSLSGFGVLLLTRSEFTSQLAISTLVAPLVEETLKGAAVLIVYLLFKPEFDSPLDGIVYGGIAALGFAATENVWYIHQLGFLQNGFRGLVEVSIVRIFLVGWQHPFYTAFTGLGLALSRRSREGFWRWLFPFIGWSFAVAFHTLHNLFVSLASGTSGNIFTLIWDWSGYLGLLILILLLIQREQKWMKEYLAPVRDEGLLSANNYQIATSAWRQGFAVLEGISKGKARYIKRYYQACGNLMHKLRQSSSPENEIEINRIRRELKFLTDLV